MTSAAPSLVLANLLAGIPQALRDPLLDEYNKIARNYRERRWEPAELNGGKLCEVVYSVLHGYTSGSYPAGPSKPANMVDACRALERADSTKFSRAIRIQIPRVLIALYEVRNKRGVGHVGGDVSPNHMDATLVFSMSQWIVAELIRVFHGVDTETATKAVDVIVDRTVPLIWSVDGKIRVLNNKLSAREKLLVILYSRGLPTSVRDVAAWIEYTNVHRFRNNVVETAHKERLLELDRASDEMVISPLGMQFVESNIQLEV